MKKNYLCDKQADKFEIVVGKTLLELAKELKTMPLEQVAEWFTQPSGLGELLDQKISVEGGSFKPPEELHDIEDEVTYITTGYGGGRKPEDHFNAFKDFVNANSNRLVAIEIVVQNTLGLNPPELKGACGRA